MDALVLGLNAVSDGLNVVLPTAATELAATLKARGYKPGARRARRAAQVRRQRQVLHDGAARLTSRQAIQSIIRRASSGPASSWMK